MLSQMTAFACSLYRVHCLDMITAIMRLLSFLFCYRRFGKMLKLPGKKTAMREANAVFAFDNFETTTYTKNTV